MLLVKDCAVRLAVPEGKLSADDEREVKVLLGNCVAELGVPGGEVLLGEGS